MSHERRAQIDSRIACAPLWPALAVLLAAFFTAGANTKRQERPDLTLPAASEIGEAAVEDQAATTRIDVKHRREASCSLDPGGDPCRNDEHWSVVIRGKEYGLDAIQAPLKVESDESPETEIDPQVGVALSARRILIRADRAAPYGHVNRIIELCSRVGIYKIELAARLDEREGKFACWLPRASDALAAGATAKTPAEIRVAIFRNEADRKTIRKLGNRIAGSDAELELLLAQEHERHVRSHETAPVTLDAEAGVSWSDVINVINLCKKARIDEIEFALPVSR